MISLQTARVPGSFLQRAVRNFLFSGLGTAANLILGFLFAGLTIRYLGEARAGYFMALAALTGLNTLLGDFGLGVPAVRRVAALNAAGDLATARRVVGSICTTSLASSLSVAVLVIVCFTPIFRWARLSGEYENDAYFATVFTLAGFVLSQASSPWRSTYNALERYDLISVLDSVFGLLSGVCGIGILIVAPTMTALAATRLFLSLVRFVVDAGLSRRLLQGTIWPAWYWPLVKPLLRFGTWVYIGNLGSLLLGRVISLILTTTLGSAALPYYELPQRLYTQIHGAIASQSQFLFPMLASYGDRVVDQIRRVEDRLRWLIAVASGGVYCAIGLLGVDLISAIVNPEFASRVRPLLYLACIQGFFEAQDVVPYFCSHAIGIGHPNSLIYLSQSICVAGTALMLILHFGVLGASVAQLWVIPAVVAHLVWVQKLISPTRPRLAWISSYLSPCLMILVWLTAALLARRITRPGLVPSLVACVVGAVAGGAVLFIVEANLLKHNERWATFSRIILHPFNRAASI